MVEFAKYFLERGVKQFYFLGGEPLVRPDLEEIIETLRKSGKKVGLRIATNGMLATPERTKSLFEEGADDFQVSFEGATKASHESVRGVETFEKAISGVRNFREVGAYVTIALTIGHHNLGEIAQIFELARKVDAQELKLSLFVPMGTGARMRDMLLTSADVQHARILIKKFRSLYPELKINSDLDIPDNIGTQCGSCFGCGAGTTTLVLNPDFSISACDLLMEEDRCVLPTKSPYEIDDLWKKGVLFQKWRGCAPKESTKSVQNFEGVHQNGCHLVNSLYGDELGVYKF